MTVSQNEHVQAFALRKAKEEKNLFSRLPAVYAASRTQGQRFLQLAGGLSILEWRTLWDLHQAGPLRVRDLASLQRADHSLISRALPDMKRKGYVSMRRDEEDGRQMIVELAEKGVAAYEKAAPVMRARREALREVFSAEEIDTFIGLIDRLEEFLCRPVDQILSEETPDVQ